MVLEPVITSIFRRWERRPTAVKLPARDPPLVSGEKGLQARQSLVGGVQGSALP